MTSFLISVSSRQQQYYYNMWITFCFSTNLAQIWQSDSELDADSYFLAQKVILATILNNLTQKLLF